MVALIFPLACKPEQAMAGLVAAAAQCSLKRPLQLELWASAGQISHHLEASPTALAAATAGLQTVLPGLRVESSDRPDVELTAGFELRATSPFRGLRASGDSPVPSALLAVLGGLRRGEAVCLQWLLAPTTTQRPPAQQTARPRSFTERLLGPATMPTELRRDYQHKLHVPLLRAVGRVAVAAGSRSRRTQLLGEVFRALNTANRSGVRLRRSLHSQPSAARRLRQVRLPLLGWPMTLNAAEVAPLLGWPIDLGSIPGLRRGAARLLPPTASLPRSGSVLGDSASPPLRAVALGRRDRLQHLHVIGPTGSGKSVLLANLALQDAARGDGLLLVDPKGDLITDLLARLPHDRHADVAIIEPGGGKNAVGLNLLAARSGDDELVVEQITHAFRQLFASSWGPRTDDILRAGLRTLVRAKQTYTLCELEPLLTSPAFRARLTADLGSESQLISFWAWFDELSSAERATVIAPLLNKLRAFTMRPSLRAMLGQPTGIDLGSVFSAQAIVLVNLNKGLLGGDVAGLLGALIVGQFWTAALRQASRPANKRRFAWAYLDEFQDILRLPTNTGDLLAQARGLHLGLVLAHQSLGQLTTSVRGDVLANARSRVMFKLARDDAHLLAREYQPHLDETDLNGLAAYEAYGALQADSTAQPPCTITTRPLDPPIHGQADRLRADSLRRHGRPISEVEAAIAKRAGHRTRQPNATNTVLGRVEPGGAR